MTGTGLETPDAATRDAFRRCGEDVRRRARNFWYGLRLLPPDRFDALCAIYAWMRRVDDIADEDTESVPVEVRRASLDRYRERTRALFRGDPPEVEISDPLEGHIWHAMDRVVREHRLDPADFESMIDGQVADLLPRRIEDLDALTTYCDQVASTVGRTCVRVWGTDAPEALEMAGRRGVAFQITNILRDVREDLARDRVYLPADLLDAHGVDPSMILEWSEPARCTRLIRALTAIAREGYRASADLESMLDPACRPTSWAMNTIYRSLLDKIEHRPSLLGTTNRVRLSSLRKAAIALRARRFAWYGAADRGEVPR